MPDAFVPLRGLLIAGSARMASCWEISRTDGVVLRFTDHNRSLIVDGHAYTPAAAPIASARQRTEGLQAQNLEARGALASDAITNEDLRAGRYRRATVRELVVDWQYPWVGRFKENAYIVRDTTFTGETWDAQIEGLLARLAVKVGYTFERRCRWQRFGDANCGLDLTSRTQTGRTVTAVDTDRKKFTSSIATGRGDGFFDDGTLVWTSGPNLNVICDVKFYVQSGGVITLQVRAPFTISPGDAFTVKPGCDRQPTTCQGFGNFTRYGGFPDLPGTDNLLETPSG